MGSLSLAFRLEIALIGLRTQTFIAFTIKLAYSFDVEIPLFCLGYGLSNFTCRKPLIVVRHGLNMRSRPEATEN